MASASYYPGNNFKFGFRIGGGPPQPGSMQPGFDNGNNNPNSNPSGGEANGASNPGPLTPNQLTEEQKAAQARRESEQARIDRVAAEQKRVAGLKDQERQAYMRSQYSQRPSSGSAQDYLAATGIDPEIFNRRDQETRRQLNDQYFAASQFRPTFDMGAANSARASQVGLAQLLQQRASGQNSVTAEMLRAQGERSAEQAFANARANSAYNPGMAQMLGEMSANQARSQAAEQGRIAAMQEQQQAQDALSGLYGQMRGQDLQASGMGSQLQLQAEQLRRQGQMGALEMQNSMSEADRQALIAREQLVSRFALAGQEIDAANSRAAADRIWRVGAGVAQGLAEGAMRAYA